MSTALTDEQARAVYPQVLKLALWLTNGNRATAEDLCQDAFLGVLRRAELPEHLPGFLATSVRNAARSRARHERCLLVEALDEDRAGPDDVAEEATTRVALDDALAALAGERHAPALVAVGLGWRQADCAARAGVSPQAVKIGIHRLRHGPIARLSPYRIDP